MNFQKGGQTEVEDLEFVSHDYVTYNMACEYYRLGIKPVVRMAHEAGAVYKIGKKAQKSLYNLNTES